MSTIDPKFIPLSTIQEQFWDKLEDAPMAAGTLTFYSDASRTMLKDVYALTGVFPDYTYVSLGSTLTLSSIGTFDDGLGNNLVPYLYPYEGIPTDNSSTVEQYYIVVTNSDSQFQFSVSAVPYLPSTIIPPEVMASNNYIPNGQFLLHRDLIDSGKIVATTTDVAYGGWQYVRQTNSSVEYVKFARFDTPIANPTGNPRYACQLNSVTPLITDTSKIFQIKFKDVNNFSDFNIPPQSYTLLFSGKSNNTANVPITVSIYKYFGSGGSPDVTVPVIEDITITPTYQSFLGSFSFGSNQGKLIGTNDDDYVAIQLSLPPTVPFDISLTDFVLSLGENTVETFPITTDGQMQRDTFGTSFPTPNPDGSDIGLPIILSSSGWVYDYSQVGKIEATACMTAGDNEVLCDGSSYDPATVNAIGIPYSRVLEKTFDYTKNFSYFGTGADFLTSVICSTATNQIMINTNSAGTSTTAIEGTVATGFTFSPPICLGNSTYGFVGGIDDADYIYLINTITGAAFSAASAGTSGFTVITSQTGTGGTPNGIVNIVRIQSATVPAAGAYFIIANTTTTYWVWFKINGSGTAPTPPPGTLLIEIDLLSTHTIYDVRQIIINALAGYNISNITTLIASSIPTGSYFKIYNSSNDLYYVWYQKAGVGADPAPAGAVKGIKVALTGFETDIQVAFKTQYAINSAMWTAPDLRGAFLRGIQGTATNNYDPDFAWRLAYVRAISRNLPGSYQYNQNLQHSHTYVTLSGFQNADGSNTNYWQGTSTDSTAVSGGNQSNPANIYVNYVIKI